MANIICKLFGHTDRVEKMPQFNGTDTYSRVWSICRRCGQPLKAEQ